MLQLLAWYFDSATCFLLLTDRLSPSTPPLIGKSTRVSCMNCTTCGFVGFSSTGPHERCRRYGDRLCCAGTGNVLLSISLDEEVCCTLTKSSSEESGRNENSAHLNGATSSSISLPCRDRTTSLSISLASRDRISMKTSCRVVYTDHPTPNAQRPQPRHCW